ncbi:IS256 family transposase, partial [Pseudobacteriovorax antillogorgiicola]
MRENIMSDVKSIVQINESEVKNHLSEMVRTTVEDTLNTMLDQEADKICGAKRYERSEGRKDTRAGSYGRKLQTKAGEVNLKVPRLRKLPFESMIIERYRRREASVEEALIEMYLAGVSVRRVEDITEALWGTKVSAGTVSKLNQKIYGRIETWLERPISGTYSYVYLDGIWMKRSWGGEVRNVSILVAIGVDADGYREVLGAAEGAKEDFESWRKFVTSLKSRGLSGVELFISDKCLGLTQAIGACFPEARWQRCTVHFYRNVFSVVPKGRVKEVAAMLKAVHASEDLEAADAKAKEIISKLEDMRLPKAASCVREGINETFSYYHFPREHWTRIKTNNMLERVMREIRRRTR